LFEQANVGSKVTLRVWFSVFTRKNYAPGSDPGIYFSFDSADVEGANRAIGKELTV
jgi:hypothetical protein